MKRILLSLFALGLATTGTVYGQYYNDGLDVDPMFTRTDVSHLPPVEGTEAVAAIQPVNNYNDLLLYPNPVASSTRVVLNETPASNVYIDVIDLNGHVDRTFEYAPGSYDLDVNMSGLPTGMYSVRVSGRDVGYHNLKVTKE